MGRGTMSHDSKLYLACTCRSLVCPVTLLVIGCIMVIGGGVVAAVGFGKPAFDMFDIQSL